MIKKIVIFFLSILFTLNIGINTSALDYQSENIKQGFYSLKDLNLIPSAKYNVLNESNTESMFLVVFDSQNRVNQAVRLEPMVTSSLINPLQITYKIVVVGSGTLAFYVQQ